MTKNELIKLFEESQLTYSSSKERLFLKNNSQFFTPSNIAYKILETIDFKSISNLDKIKFLEPSAGCGILILTLVLHLIDNTNIKNIKIDAYELDTDIYIILKNNLVLLKTYVEENSDIELVISIKNKNFILDNTKIWSNKEYTGLYDIIISNPPFDKINQSSEEALVMKDIVYGQPNIYTLFIGMCLKLLKTNGIYSVVSPRNYLSGDYSKKLRKYIFNNFRLSHIHSFDNRSIFKFVNQEIIISTYINNNNNDEIKISHNGKFELKTSMDNIIYDKENLSIVIPNSAYSISILDKFKALEYSLLELDLKVSVGPIVQFRNMEFISKDLYCDEFAPLLIANDLKDNNNILYYTRENHPNRKTHNKSIRIDNNKLLKNSNYLLLRKVTAKNDKNTIVPIVLRKDFFNHDLLGLDNNLLYFHSLDKSNSLSLNECYGLYCFFNSIYFEEYYLLINGTHTINISDFNSIKLPSLEIIISIGKKIININKFDKSTCSNIIDEFLFNTNKNYSKR